MTPSTVAASTATGDAIITGALILLALAALAGYAVACALWPFAACRWCRGSGRHRSPTGKSWRTCRHCHGGAKLRAGRRLWITAQTTHDRGSRPDRARPFERNPWRKRQ